MSSFQIIVPVAATNMYSDPGFWLADPDTAWTIAGDGGAPDFTRSYTQQWTGPASALAVIDGGSYVRIYQALTTTGAASTYTNSARLRRSGGGALTSAHAQSWFAGIAYDWDTITAIGDGWYECVHSRTVAAGTYDFGVNVLENSLCVDGCQMENITYTESYATTYIDGYQDGCSWDGAVDTSSSTRSALSRAGGLVYDLEDDLYFYVERIIGGGAAPRRLFMLKQSIQPGQVYQSTKIEPVTLQLVGTITGTSLADLHDNRQNLYNYLAPPERILYDQPFILRYTGGSTYKYIRLYYDGGLESNLTGCPTEMRVVLRFVAPDPFWYGMDDGIALDVEDTLPVVIVAGRVDGAWDGLGPPSAVTADGGNTDIYGIVIGKDKSVYYGGRFLDFDGDANADRIVQWDGAAWNALGTGRNHYVFDLAMDQVGDIYAVGTFTSAGNDDFIARWDVSGSTWNAVGIPVAGAAAITSVNTVAVDQNGYVWIGGDFLNFADVANADYIAYWDGTAWNAASTGMNATVRVLAVDINGDILAGGEFTSAGAGSASYAARWDGTTWTELGNGVNGAVFALAVGPDGKIYAGGSFTQDGDGNTLSYIGVYDGTGFNQMGTGLNNTCLEIVVGPDGMVYASGSFTVAGGATLADRIAKWNGFSWGHLDINLPGTPMIYAMAVGEADPVVPENYDLYIGFNNQGNALVSGTVAPNSTIYLPTISFYRSGGTSATLAMLRNENTGQEIQFNYPLLDGEKLTVDLRRAQQMVSSDYYGTRLDAVLPGSDFSSFEGIRGSHTISAFVINVGATITAEMWWPQTWGSYDD